MSKGITKGYKIKSIDSKISDIEYGDMLTVDLNDKMDPDANLGSIRILSTRIPVICYNIVDKKSWSNTKLRINVGGTEKLITLGSGYYPGGTLVNTLMTEITAAYTAEGYSAFIDWNEIDFTTTIRITNAGGIDQNFTMRSEVEKPTDDDTFVPSILQLLGFGEVLPSVWPIVYSYVYPSQPGHTSEGPLNIFQDRSIIITCDQVQGANTNFDDPGPESWSHGVVASLSFQNANPGDVINTDLWNDAMVVPITVKGSTRTLNFRLARSMYPYFGPDMVMWEMILEIS